MKDDDFEAREALIRAHIRRQADAAIKFRSKDRAFHGLEREFLHHQEDLLRRYEKARDAKHPRDVGAAREQILRTFLQSSGYLPKRYGVSERSVRVASTMGHLSGEIDIALVDPLDAVTLMNREDVYEVYPAESVHGVIQVKSKLTKVELRSGLKNLRSFKSLARQTDGLDTRPGSDRGFAILFAFESDLGWMELVREIENAANAHPREQWPNAVVILDRGYFLHGEEGAVHITNAEIARGGDLRMHGYPDRQGHCLFALQSLLLRLLRSSAVRPAELDAYFKLPLIAAGHSYSFFLREFAEVGDCREHGPFQRTIAPHQLDRLIAWCSARYPISNIEAIDRAYDQLKDPAIYEQLHGDVRIYNPDGLPLSQILAAPVVQNGVETRVIAFDMIQTAGMMIYLPHFYSEKEGIISQCPTCFPPPKKTRRRRLKA